MKSFFKRKQEAKAQVETGPALVSSRDNFPDIYEDDFWKLYEVCKPFTMTSVERMYALFKAVNYTLAANIPGDFIECGVWKGGSALLMAKMLAANSVQDRKILLYDTYEGMPPPTENDKDFAGKTAEKLLQNSSIEVQDSVWCYSSFEEVKNNISLSGLSEDKILMIQGKVEDTIPQQLPSKQIALLRLDTDWYESTRHELIHLYPLLAPSGILIIDDYGHWQGCRKAVDEYFMQNNISLLLNRIDNTGRLAVKP